MSYVSAAYNYVSLVMRSTLTHVLSLSSLYTTSRLQPTKGSSLSMSTSMSTSMSMSMSMSAQSNSYRPSTSNYVTGLSKAAKNTKTKGSKTIDMKNTAEYYIARNFAIEVRDFIQELSGKKIPMDMTFNGGGGGDNGGFMPRKYVNKCVQVVTGVSDLVMGIVTAKDANQVKEALKIDFTNVVRNMELTPAGEGGGGGLGSGFQLYLKNVEVLSVGGGGGGGCDQVISESSVGRNSKSGKQSNKLICIGRGSGGGGQLSVRFPKITTTRSKSGKVRKLVREPYINVGGGQGAIEDGENAGEMVFSFDDDYYPDEFIEHMKRLRELLSEADIDDIAVLGGGGGGGAGCGPQGAATIGGGYGFGFNIGTPTAIARAKKKEEDNSKSFCEDPLSFLSEEDRKEPWALDQKRYIKKHVKC